MKPLDPTSRTASLRPRGRCEGGTRESRGRRDERYGERTRQRWVPFFGERLTPWSARKYCYLQRERGREREERENERRERERNEARGVAHRQNAPDPDLTTDRPATKRVTASRLLLLSFRSLAVDRLAFSFLFTPNPCMQRASVYVYVSRDSLFPAFYRVSESTLLFTIVALFTYRVLPNGRTCIRERDTTIPHE